MLRRHLIGAALLAAATGRTARASCPVAATVPVTIRRGVPIVVATVDGQPLRMILDTGAVRSLVTPGAAARLRLRRDQWAAIALEGVGGIERRPVADVRALALGPVALHRRSIAGDLSVAVGDMPSDAGAEGLLGADMLWSLALDLDYAAGVLRLGPPCAVSAPTSAVVVRLIAPPERGFLVLGASLNGRSARVLLDTGSARSLLTREGALVLGPDGPSEVTGPPAEVRGVGPNASVLRPRSIARLDVGADRVADFVALAGDVTGPPGIDMILGGDWLAGRRVLIDYPGRFVALAPRSPG